MVAGIPSARSVFVPRLYHAQRAGKTRIPVRPTETVYAHFEHVEGVPSRSETVPLIKLRVLDRLIDRMAGVRRVGSGEAAPAPEAAARVSRAPRTYAPPQSGPTAPYAAFAAPPVQPGALVSVLA